MGDVIGMPGIEQVALKQTEVTWSDALRDFEIALAVMIHLKGIDEVESIVGRHLEIAWAVKDRVQAEEQSAAHPQSD